MIVEAIKKAITKAQEFNWEKTYWAFDIHDTILKPNWDSGQIPTEYYPYAKESLQLLNRRKDIVMFLYTCSHPKDTDQYVDFFKADNIHFDFVNENPEIPNSALGYYDKKPYFNVLMDDKAGFNPITEWPEILQWIKENPG